MGLHRQLPPVAVLPAMQLPRGKGVVGSLVVMVVGVGVTVVAVMVVEIAMGTQRRLNWPAPAVA